jgi:hypothetical protein
LFIGSEPTEYDDPNEVPFFGDENGYGNEETELRRSSGSHIPLDRPDPNLFSTPSSYRRLVQDLLNDTYYERTGGC